VTFLFDLMPTLGGSPDLYPSDYGYGLAGVYCVWILVVALMYRLCLWFCRLKEGRRYWRLSYF
jgi:hypothetical protein